jgi:MoxR-like ATPase
MKDVCARVIDEIGRVYVGNRQQVELAVACLLAEGHLLLEDLPGLGKTTLARTLARVLRLDHDRVQFTADLLPSDILGMSIFNRQEETFSFQPGPVFTQVLLADEVNRATPRTQSALLEAMSEAQVTIDGMTRPLPTPFFVIATQNPANQSGTYPLPESQLDRFLMKLSLGYPDQEAERVLLQRGAEKVAEAAVPAGWLMEAREAVQACYVSDSVLDYLQRLIAYTRESAELRVGLSPRGGMALASAARAVAVMTGRDHVIPEDIQRVLAPVAGHRVQAATGASADVRILLAGIASQVDSISHTG